MDLAFICKCLHVFLICLYRYAELHDSCQPHTFSCRYGVVLRKLDLVKEAIDVFVEAAHVLPLHWGAWLELCNLITDKEMVKLWRYQDLFEFISWTQ